MLTEKAQEHLRVAGAVLQGLEAELGERLGAGDLAVMRGELARLVRHLAGESLPALRPHW